MTTCISTLEENQIIDAIFRFVVFDLGGEHHVGRFTYLTHYVGERVIGHFSLNIKLFRNVIVIEQIIREFVMKIVV